MTETLTAARIPLDGPAPRPPLHSILSVATEVTEDIRGGAVVVPYPPAMPDSTDPCADASERLKDTPLELTIPDGFPVFRAYLGEICTAYNIGDWDEWKARANLALVAREAWALERQLVNAAFQLTSGSQDTPNLAGAGGAPDPSLPAGTGAVPVRTAFAWLDAAIAATGQQGVIHAPPPAVTAAGDILVDDRGVLRTATGTPVIAGTGYWFADSDTAGDAAGGTSAAAGQSWMYATGPVLYQRGRDLEAMPSDISEALDREVNEVIYRAERDLWVAWDGQLQAAVLADWSP